ncbi:hypothetical protein ACFPYJ_02750 [Paenibacillus solisilvae]|uniref:Uncharacterized protein n=1 Tax=Paenibacillus solisilvae TaxID=2486751 RepID=A0ABW0VVE9_9BACL
MINGVDNEMLFVQRIGISGVAVLMLSDNLRPENCLRPPHSKSPADRTDGSLDPFCRPYLPKTTANDPDSKSICNIGTVDGD